MVPENHVTLSKKTQQDRWKTFPANTLDLTDTLHHEEEDLDFLVILFFSWNIGITIIFQDSLINKLDPELDDGYISPEVPPVRKLEMMKRTTSPPGHGGDMVEEGPPVPVISSQLKSGAMVDEIITKTVHVAETSDIIRLNKDHLLGGKIPSGKTMLSEQIPLLKNTAFDHIRLDAVSFVYLYYFSC